MATPCISPPKLLHHDGFSNIVQVKENASRLRNCSARHVTNCDNAMNCRFAYATWCPVCEEQEKNNKILYHNGRRRSKSEGMDDRSDHYYTKTTNSDVDQCHSSVNFTKDRESVRKLGFQSCKRFNLDSNEYFLYSSRIEKSTHNKHFPAHSSANRQICSGVKKITRNMRKPCENHIEPNRICFDSWTSSSEEWIYPQRENELMPLHERYYYEVEMLRNKLHKLKELPSDGKRTRQNCELDCNVAPPLSEIGSKRPRDISPSNYMSTTSRKLPAVPVPRCTPKIQNSSCKPNQDRKSNVLSSGSATSFSSDSDLNDSGCDEEELKDVNEVDYEEDEQAYLNCAKPAINSSYSPSYSPSHLLNSISINDNVGVAAEVDQGKLHPSLRASLFSHVPPYIRFSTHEVKGAALPPPVQKLLKWKLSTITPVVVRRTVANSNFKLVRKSNEWCGTWGKHMKSLCFKTIREQQKINHFPGTFQIGRKDRLWKNLFRLMTKFGKKEFGFIPRTYVLPQDNKLLRSAWEKNCGKERWIVKPPASARGTGIKVIHKWTQIPKKCPLVVQKYISDPYLINGSKFDLRLYVLVTSINPLRIYMYDNGLVRFASVKYSNEMTSLADRYMHLTNYSINKQSSQYTQNGDANACQGHKWSLHALWSHLRQQGVAVTTLWHTLVDLVIKTIISGESAISQLSNANLASRYCSYELFGVDVLLDEQLKPWLLEVNISPSLHSSSPLDLAVKGPMVQDLMNIAGYQIPSKLSTQMQSEMAENLGLNPGTPLCLDRRLYTTALSNEERLKHVNFQQTEVREDYMTEILHDLTPDDVRHLVQYEDELTQIGNFQKIFPTTETHEYHQFFEAPRYYNMLFDAWEVKQSKDRTEGINLLESLCQEQVHLDTTHIPPKRTKVSASPSGNDLKSLEPDQLEYISEDYEEDTPTAAPNKNKKNRVHMLLKRIQCLLLSFTKFSKNTKRKKKYIIRKNTPYVTNLLRVIFKKLS